MIEKTKGILIEIVSLYFSDSCEVVCKKEWLVFATFFQYSIQRDYAINNGFEIVLNPVVPICVKYTSSKSSG